MTGKWDGGRRIAGAAELAVKQVNAEGGIAGRTLGYAWADSGCSQNQVLVGMGKLLGKTSSAVIGPACSKACEVTSLLF